VFRNPGRRAGLNAIQWQGSASVSASACAEVQVLLPFAFAATKATCSSRLRCRGLSSFILSTSGLGVLETVEVPPLGRACAGGSKPVEGKDKCGSGGNGVTVFCKLVSPFSAELSLFAHQFVTLLYGELGG